MSWRPDLAGPKCCSSGRLESPRPESGQVSIRQTAVGVNYIDVYIRKGLYKMIEPPAPIGMEAAGVVVESNAPGFRPGDRVAYACTPPGAYATMRTLAASQVVLLPDYISDETAAAVMLKGMTAEYLLHRTHRVRPGDAVLVHAAAGGVGLLLCQWAKALGARVMGTVSSEAKAEFARANGCDQVVVTRDYRFASQLKNRADVDLRRPRARSGEGESRSARHARPLGELRPGERGARIVSGPDCEVGDAIAPGAVPLHRRAPAGNGRQRVRAR